MKTLKFLLLCFAMQFFISCEEVVEIDLNTAAPRLVIDAFVDVYEDGSTIAAVNLTETRGYYNNNIPFVTDAEVRIVDSQGNVYPMENDINGIYIAAVNIMENLSYTLEVTYHDELYTATTSFVPSVPIQNIEQDNNGGFSGDEIEVSIFFQDPAEMENYYFIDASSTIGRDYDVINDEFLNGNLISYSFNDEDLSAGDEIIFQLYGINEQYYNYLFTLFQQTGNSNGPFGTQPATVRGNIINQTNPDNFAFGYFRISGVSIENYIVE